MKKIIGGKRYDTESATALGTYSNGSSWNDFTHVEETLYRKRTGECFLHGEGGPMTAYRRYEGANNWTGGEELRPLTDAEARQWAEEHLTAGEYEEAFGPVSEAAGDESMYIRTTAATAAAFRAAARERGLSAGQMLADLLKTSGIQ